MNRMEYYNSIYDKFWQRQTHRYGVTEYEKVVLNSILKKNAKNVFSCAIGTGWSIEQKLYNNGVNVDGCDVAENSVKEAQKKLGNNSGIYVGVIDDYKSDVKKYDVVYCMRASWYIPHFENVIIKMIDMCKDDGMVIFDIMPKEKYSNFIEIINEKYLEWVGVRNDTPKLCYYSLNKIKRILYKNNFDVKIVKEEEIFKGKSKCNSHKIIIIGER